jgi:hypothetical protein
MTLAVGCTAAFWIAVPPLPVHAQNAQGILRVRGLVIEDSDGRARIVLGAPVPSVKGMSAAVLVSLITARSV